MKEGDYKFKKLFYGYKKGNKSLKINKFTRFFILGASSTLVDYIFYSVLIMVNINYFLAILIGYSLGFIFNFYMGRWFVFQDGAKTNDSAQEFLYVILITIIGLFLSFFIVWLLSDSLFDLSLFLSRIIAIVIVFFWNYLARQYFVYY